MPTLKEIRDLEHHIKKKKAFRRKHQERLALQESKKAEDAKAKQAELDAIQRYQDDKVMATKILRESQEVSQKRTAARDRIEGQRSYNQHKKEVEAAAIAEELAESRRKSETARREKVEAGIRAKEIKHMAMVDRIEGQQAFNILHKMAEEEAVRASVEENRRKSETLKMRRMDAELSTKHAARVANAGAVEQRRLFKQREAEAEKAAEQDMINEYRRNSHASTKAREEAQNRARRDKTLSNRGRIEAARLSKQNMLEAERTAIAAEMAENKAKSETLKARQAREFEERKQAQRAAREERMEIARQKKRLEAEEAAALQLESTLRSYGGLMALPGSTPQIPRSPRARSPRSVSPRSVSPRSSPRSVSPRSVSPRSVSPRSVSPRSSPHSVSPRSGSPRSGSHSLGAGASPRSTSPRPSSPRSDSPRSVSPRTTSTRPRHERPGSLRPSDGTSQRRSSFF